MTPGQIRSLVTITVLSVTAVVAIVWLRRRFPHRVGRRTAIVLAALTAAGIAIFELLSVRVAYPAAEGRLLGVYELVLLALGTSLAIVWSTVLLEGVLASPRFFRRIVRRPEPPPDAETLSRRAAIARVGSGVLAATGVVTVGWGALRTRFDVEVVEIPIRLPRLPRALDGFSIVQISDIHIGPFFRDRPLREAEDVIRRLKPDLIAMTGDLIDVQPAWIPDGASFLSRLIPLARHGVAAIPGNHEHYAGAFAVMDALRRAGVDVLFNDGRLVAPGDGGGFSLVGVDDVSSYKHHRGPGPLAGAALAKLPPDRARILLCHQPSYLPQAAGHGFDLMLSGHTHGGQISPVGVAVVAGLFDDYAGLGRLEDTQIYVNRGLGTSGPPVRVGIRPEITKIVLVAG